MEKNILNIYCPSCGAPAEFDIIHQEYRCRYCGGKVSIEKAKLEKEETILRGGERKIDKEYSLECGSCSGCGATIVFEESEALSHCEFCGRSLVRKRYTKDTGIPRYVIPFGLTRDEAVQRLEDWCTQNGRRPEAKHLKYKAKDVRGYYLPYEMVHGPVHCTVSKRSVPTKYEASGYLNGEFINCSAQFDNMVLDAMEPFNTDNLQEFDFAYVAGHRVKITDIDHKTVSERMKNEAAENYRARLEQLWGTRSIDVSTTFNAVVRCPVLLPVYYVCDGDLKAAVNGQTGKVSVCAETQGAYFSLPWWIKGIGVLLLALAATFGIMLLRGMDSRESLFYTGILGFFYFIVFLAMLGDGGSKEFGLKHYRLIFNSGEQTFRREKGKLIVNDEVLRRKIAEPVFLLKLDGKDTPVSYTFRSPQRTISMVALSLLAVFFPVIIALFINGFDFGRLNLGGSAVWFCITVPTVPIILVRFGIQWLYDSPWVYIFDKNGKRKRYRKKREKMSAERFLRGFGNALAYFIIPPVCLIVWAVLGALGVMIYLTAFGF